MAAVGFKNANVHPEFKEKGELIEGYAESMEIVVDSPFSDCYFGKDLYKPSLLLSSRPPMSGAQASLLQYEAPCTLKMIL